ncbi:hypothetical protein RQP46_004276 [Phenoliferia psychrophenolica]
MNTCSHRYLITSSLPPSLSMDGTTLPDAAASSAARRRSISFPPEILLHIISLSTAHTSWDLFPDLSDRNVALVQLALVSRAFRAATYSVLYGDLRLPWMADTVKKLYQSFANNPNLLPLVRRLEACAITEHHWVDYEPFTFPAQPTAEWLEEYCKREEIIEGTERWSVLHAAPVEEGQARRAWAN